MINGHIDNGYIISAVLVAAAVTFVLRVLPFGLKKALAGSEILDALSHWIPLGAVALLAIYAISRIDFSSTHTAVPYLAGFVVTALVHLWKKNMVYSMIAGTATCVILINWVSRGIACLKDLHTPAVTLGTHRSKPATNRFSILSPLLVW